MRRLRRYLLVGLVVIAPVGITLYVLAWVFVRLDAILGRPLEGLLGVHIPGLGFLLLALFVLLVGWLVHRAVGRQLLQWWNAAVLKFPLAGRVYNALSQIVQSMLGGNRQMFRRTVLVQFPATDMWTVGFVTHEAPAALSAIVGEPCINVFVPITPVPHSGWVLVAPVRLVKETTLSVEDAMKLVVSMGALAPGDQMSRMGRQGLDLDRLLQDEGR
jgi:uncharacterized membrane protein